MAKEICVLQERDDIGEIYLTFIAFKITWRCFGSMPGHLSKNFEL